MDGASTARSSPVDTNQPPNGMKSDEPWMEPARKAFAPFGLTLPNITTQADPVELPLNHIFTRGTPGACGGMYTREIFMPSGAWVFSHIHRTSHPFVVLSGIAMVWTPEKGVETLTGGYLGVTDPGTQRILYIVEDTVWATFHATDLQDVEVIEKALVERTTSPTT